MRVTRNVLQKRVKLGAHLLDKKMPKWFEDVVLSQLDMGDGDVCILGQAGGDYSDTAVLLGVAGWNRQADWEDARAIRHGFNLGDKEWDSKRVVSMLHELWAVEVAMRQVAKR